jgi:hypothetical protein
MDPAAVAAASSVAAALLGTAAGTTQEGALPPAVPPAPSLPPTSRYAEVGTAVWTAPDGREVAYLRRRVIPDPAGLATSGWQRVPDGDRVDLLAARALGEPTAFWRLADANLAFDPAELEEPGRIVRVALPEGFPGA